MQRDRLMTGVHSGAVDVVWLLNNLEVASIPVSVDAEQFREVQTLVLGPKGVSRCRELCAGTVPPLP